MEITQEMIDQFFIDIFQAIRNAIPVEIREAMDESRRVDPCEGMTSEERARWIMGE
jgi:hypothetical protein